MDPVRILDHYRLPLVTSRESIQLLARLLRDGPQRTTDLAKSLDTGIADVNRLLNALYRAAFVEHRKVDLWAIAHLGEQVLERLQVLDLASVDLVKALVDAPSDRLFLIRWLKRPSEAKDSRTCLSLLRSLNQVTQLHRFPRAKRKEDRSSLLYAILIAGDSWAQQAGIENVAEAIRRGLESRLLADPQPRSVEQDFNTDSVASAWREGMHKYMSSNRLLLFMPNVPPSSTDEDTVQFTWLRALDAALGGTADQGLRASCQSWQRNDASVFWRFMFKRKSLEKDTRTMLARWAGIHEPTTEVLLAELTDRLLQAVGKTPLAKVESIAGPTTNVQDDFNALVSMLRRASQRVRQEGVEVVPEEIQETLRSALTEFRGVFPIPNEPQPESERSNKRMRLTRGGRKAR